MTAGSCTDKDHFAAGGLPPLPGVGEDVPRLRSGRLLERPRTTEGRHHPYSIALRAHNQLPDLVFDLHGLVDFEAVARVDSIRSGIRVTFASIPDAPIAKVIVEMKGSIVNSTNLCARKNSANVRLDAHSGKRVKIRPLVRARCGAKKRRPGRR